MVLERSQGTIVRSAATAVILAWSMRLIGLFSVLVLARLLTPADFGIVALAMSTLALADVFSALGLRQSLILCRNPDRSHYDTAWTIQLIVLVALFLLLLLTAPLVSRFYGQPALTLVVSVLATRFLFYGLANIGTVDFDRELDFRRDLRMRVFVRILAFAISVTAAIVLRNYWALVIGAVAQAVLHMAATYVFHPFRPRFSIARRAELLGISLWMFLVSAAQTAHDEAQRIIVGRIGTPSVLGFYSVSKDLSHIFTQEIATALNRVTFVTRAQSGKLLSEETGRLAATLGVYAMIAAPMGLGIAATSSNAVALLLGEQWREAAVFLVFIAPASALFAVHKLLISTLLASGKARRAAGLAVGSTVLIVMGAIIAVAAGGSALEIAQSTLVVAIVQITIGLWVMSVTAHTGFMRLFGAVARPFIAATGMGLVVTERGFTSQILVVDFAIAVLIGATSYIAILLSTWALALRPEGAEANLIDLLTSRLKAYVSLPSADQ
jgi:O-antigen/teichoic acid export membrane protein